MPRAPRERTGQTVAVVGSGPAGLAVAAELNRKGHEVTVYERDEGPGGLLRFGVPDAKLEKPVIDRRVAVHRGGGDPLRATASTSGRDVTAQELRERHDAIVIAIGSRVHRDLDVARPRAARGALRDGLPLPAQPRRRAHAGPPGARARARDRVITRRGQARGRGRRRRHRHGLHLQRDPRGRGEHAHARRLPGAAGRRPAGAARRGRCRPSARSPPTRSTRAASASGATQVTEVLGDEDGRVDRRARAPGDRHLVARPASGRGQRLHRGRRPRARGDRLLASRARGR